MNTPPESDGIDIENLDLNNLLEKAEQENKAAREKCDAAYEEWNAAYEKRVAVCDAAYEEKLNAAKEKLNEVWNTKNVEEKIKLLQESTDLFNEAAELAPKNTDLFNEAAELAPKNTDLFNKATVALTPAPASVSADETPTVAIIRRRTSSKLIPTVGAVIALIGIASGAAGIITIHKKYNEQSQPEIPITPPEKPIVATLRCLYNEQATFTCEKGSSELTEPIEEELKWDGRTPENIPTGWVYVESNKKRLKSTKKIPVEFGKKSSGPFPIDFEEE